MSNAFKVFFTCLCGTFESILSRNGLWKDLYLSHCLILLDRCSFGCMSFEYKFRFIFKDHIFLSIPFAWHTLTLARQCCLFLSQNKFDRYLTHAKIQSHIWQSNRHFVLHNKQEVQSQGCNRLLRASLVLSPYLKG